MLKEIEDIIIRETHSNKILNIELIQKLWGGYGELSRVTLDTKSIIIKLIKFPKNIESNISHQRKVKSYSVENDWYRFYNDINEESYSPQLITSGNLGDIQYIMLEDLREKNFYPLKSISWEQVKLCLKWLAKFHRFYMNKAPKNLWDIGTYWHHGTRSEEHKLITEVSLKNNALLIDHKLNSAKYKTLVHGDAKLANFLFDSSQVAAIDFQYIGGGAGIKDIAYFLSSIYSEDELFQNEQKCLDYYFQQLDHYEAESEWRELYCYAWTDFYRFLSGWSPSHWKINKYSKSIKDSVLKELTKFQILSDKAIKASLAAGEVIKAATGKQIKVNKKQGNLSPAASVVTEVDLKAQDEILKILKPTLKEFDLGLLTEELVDDNSRHIKDYFWCIDPLDGTLQFSQNIEGYSVSIALLAKDGTPILGVVYDPKDENLYHAIIGHGAYKNKHQLKIKVNSKELSRYSDGPAVMNAIKTIENAPAEFIKVPKEEKGGGCLWDYAATSIIHSEAGGINSDYFDGVLELNSTNSVYMNKRGIKYKS